MARLAPLLIPSPQHLVGMRPSRVGDRGIRVEAQPDLVRASGYRAGDLVPGVTVEAGAGHHLGQEPLGPFDEPGRAG
jgi:hypothetical protein